MTYNSIYIIGATASGKSALAIDIAKVLNGVIINADSMQVYQGVKTITACPNDNELSQAPHKLYNVIDPKNDFNVVDWAELATQQIDECLKNDNVPILCGGTGFYASSFINGISPIPNVDDSIRAEVRKLVDECGGKIYATLMMEDPIMAGKLDSTDTQRIARALEVIRSTGKSLAEYQNLPKQKMPEHIKPLLIGLLPEREIVYNKINQRFEKIFDDSVDEIKKLLELNLGEHSQLMRAIGIPEIVKYINGEWDRATAIEKGQTASRQYAKRQMTFIRTQLNPDLIIESADDCEKVLELFNSHKV